MTTAAVTSLLSHRQQRILVEIRRFYTVNGYAPTIRDIAANVGLSVSAVQYQLGVLQRKGWIRRASGAARSLVVLDPATGGA